MPSPLIATTSENSWRRGAGFAVDRLRLEVFTRIFGPRRPEANATRERKRQVLDPANQLGYAEF
jgi:hypothetical protein